MSISVIELEKAVNSLKEAVDFYQTRNIDSERKIARDAVIQRFEYSIELSWKISMKVLGSNTRAAKPAIREMAQNGLVQGTELWFDFIEARNNTSHSYDEGAAAKVFEKAKLFLLEGIKLVSLLKTK
jgi:nucleotidyltransferase substrate binding protein (TIGR01987 family)